MNRYKKIIIAVLLSILLSFSFVVRVGYTKSDKAHEKLQLAVKYINDDQYVKAILEYSQVITISFKQGLGISEPSSKPAEVDSGPEIVQLSSGVNVSKTQSGDARGIMISINRAQLQPSELQAKIKSFKCDWIQENPRSVSVQELSDFSKSNCGTNIKPLENTASQKMISNQWHGDISFGLVVFLDENNNPVAYYQGQAQ
ncbi:MAG: hypothetical protein ABRQ26_06990 [Syntrophomonadaceae bacterium]